jgi:replicative DNA helicase
VNQLPHDLTVEQAVLGCCLLDPATIHTAISSGLRPEHFFALGNREIWSCMVTLVDQGKPVDTVSLLATLKDRGTVDSVGGVAHVSSLPDATPSAANLDYWLTRLTEKWYAREVIARATKLATVAQENTGALEELVPQVETEIYALRGLRSTGDDRKASFHRIANILEEAHQNQGKRIGLSTGILRLDRLLGGLRSGAMVVIAARPGLGKSALALNIAECNASGGIPVGYFTLEMSEDELNLRSLGTQSQVDIQGALRGELNAGDIQRITVTVGPVSRLPIHIRDRADLTIDRLRSEARRLASEHGVKLIIVDYLQLLMGSRRARDRREEVGEVSRGCKAMAKELGVPVIALSQLNREIDKDPGRRPRLSDLREAGDIEQDADAVIFLYEPSLDNMVASVSKNRNGPLGEVELTFDRRLTKFTQKAL